MRMPNLNIIVLSGRLTRDPELRYTQAGIPVLEMRIANNAFFRRSGGEWTTETTYVNIIAWQALAERTYESIGKGDAVVVTGRIHSHDWEDSDGVKRSQVNVRANRIQYLTRDGAAEKDETQEEMLEETPEEDIAEDEEPF